MRVLLANPPLSDPEGPYPAIAYLSGFLRTIGRDAQLADVSIALLRRVFSAAGVLALHSDIEARLAAGQLVRTPMLDQFLAGARWYASTVDTAIAAIVGDDRGAVVRARRAGYFPPPVAATKYWARAAYMNVHYHERRIGDLTPNQRTRLAQPAAAFDFAFGVLGESEEARYRASLMISDLATVVREGVDRGFELNAYGEFLERDSPTFPPLRDKLEGPPNLLDRWVDDLTDQLVAEHRPDLVGLSVPFAGNVHGALRMARRLRHMNPHIVIVMGGGWVNTTLRELSDPGIFDYVDYITLDDGERPLQCIIELEEGSRSRDQLLRTFVRREGRVTCVSDPREHDVRPSETGTPTYVGLTLRHYLRYRPSLQPAWYPWRARWNKLTLAHGCYWKKCAFCDVELDYISRYAPSSVDRTLERMRGQIEETGETGFHFVDEAMPPATLKRLAQRIVDEELTVTWWGNVRFDPQLVDMADLLARSGCVRMTGGLEVASDRLLTLMAKGISLAQVARVTAALTRAGISVHAYLIYGFPTQTAQETIDALEFVRQLLAHRCLVSVTWHRFGLTRHSPVAKTPEAYGVEVVDSTPKPFANYVLDYREPGGIEHSRFGHGLRRAVEAYMHGFGLTAPLSSWFDFAVPDALLPCGYVEGLIAPSATVSTHDTQSKG